jgi:hypothetical protein
MQAGRVRTKAPAVSSRYCEAVLATALAAAILSLAPGIYTGKTTEQESVRIEIRGDRIVAARASVSSVQCEDFGGIGGATLSVKPDAKIKRGSFRFQSKKGTRTLKMTGSADSRTKLHGRLRIYGTIATGQNCTSAQLRYTLKRIKR